MRKKAMELSLNVIIIAIIGIIVLVVIVFIFTGRASLFGKSLDATCADRGGTCQKLPCNEGSYAIGSVRDCDPNGGNADPSKNLRGPCCVPIKA